MFRNKKPRCPINAADREWTDQALEWIEQHLITLIDKPTILPTKDFFDRQFSGTEDDAQYVLEIVSKHLDVPIDDLELKFYSEKPLELDRGMITQKEEGEGSAGVYSTDSGKITIWIEEQQLSKPLSLIATTTHELCHHLLLTHKNVSLEGDENEWITDLLVIAHGFGIFLGNAKFSFNQYQSGDGWGGWSLSSQGYLPIEVIAYAMAAIEVRKSDQLPDWTRYMSKDLKANFKKCMRFLMA